MAEGPVNRKLEDDELGKVEIAPEVIEVIASIAAFEVEGVSDLQGSFTADVAERLGRPHPGKGVNVALDDDGITVDVSVSLTFGVSIPEVGQAIQDSILQSLLTMTGLEVRAIHIHVAGVVFADEEVSADA